MKKQGFLVLILAFCASIHAAQTLNNPIGTDGCYIVKWDCSTNSFASSNDFEADESFTFAVDITGTEWVNWLAGNSNRGLCTNFSLTSDGAQNIARDGDRLFHITGNIYGKTINIAQLATNWSTPVLGAQTAIYSNLFGFCTDPSEWWQNPSDNITGNSDCFFRTAAYTGTHTCPVFYTNDYAGNIYTWINQKGYAVPCVISEPCYSTTPGPGPDPDPDPDPDPTPIVEGSHVYTFATDAQQRGYYNRPYERYEAEPNFCETNGTFLAASDNQADLQSEASHQQAVQLINQNSYVRWKVNQAGDGLTIRFSLPDNGAGTGTTGNIDIYAGNDKVGSLTLNSYWAWQYTVNGGNYPLNTPATPGNGNVVRMRFDEMHIKLSRQVASAEYLKIVKKDNNSTPYTIDFVELEPVPAKVTFESLSGNKVQYDGSDLPTFVANNGGKIIYIPEGTWNCPNRIYIRSNGTQIIGAGMWYTTVYFNTSSNDPSTYGYRGIETDASNLRVEGIYFNTVNNQRYYNGEDSKQVGKAFMGSWGNNSVIRNCWAEHFECGAWIANYVGNGSSNLLIEHCRFRNNYADGVNCSHSSNGHTVRYCSFRNNGDDDMASWSVVVICQNVTFAYCTAENNWRASSLGIFGGKNHTAHHLAIFDALESGLRVNSDFSGPGFDTNGTINIYDVTMDHCGCAGGTRGNTGDFWGSIQGAVNIGSTTHYAIHNVTLNNISIKNSRSYGIYVRATNSKALNNIAFKNITINGATTGIYFFGARGTATYCNLSFQNVSQNMNNIPSTLSWTQDADCQPPTPSAEEITIISGKDSVHKFFREGRLFISVNGHTYDSIGRLMY